MLAIATFPLWYILAVLWTIGFFTTESNPLALIAMAVVSLVMGIWLHVLFNRINNG